MNCTFSIKEEENLRSAIKKAFEDYSGKKAKKDWDALWSSPDDVTYSSDTRNAVINLFKMMSELGLPMQNDITKDNYATYAEIASMIAPISIEQNGNKVTYEFSDTVLYFDLSENPEFAIQLALQDILDDAKNKATFTNYVKTVASTVNTNSEKLALIWTLVDKFYEGTFKQDDYSISLKQATEKFISESEEDVKEFRQAYTRQRRDILNDNSQFVDYSATEVPTRNAASVFGTKPFNLPLSALFNDDTMSGTIKVGNVYQAMVIAKLTYKLGNAKTSKSRVIQHPDIQKIIDSSNPLLDSKELVNLYNNISLSTQRQKAWDKEFKGILANIIAASFDDKNFDASGMPSLTEARNFLVQSESDSFRSESNFVIDENPYSDAIIEYYNDALTKLKEDLNKAQYTFDKVASVTKEITLQTVQTYPNKIFLVSADNKDAQKMENQSNVVIVDTKAISEDKNANDKVEPINYTDSFFEAAAEHQKKNGKSVVIVYDSQDRKKEEKLIEKKILTKTQADASKGKNGYVGTNTYKLFTNSDNDEHDFNYALKRIQKFVDEVRKKENQDKIYVVYFDDIVNKLPNGYTGMEMIDMFNKAFGSLPIPSNIVFSSDWKNHIGKEKYKTEIDDIVQKLSTSNKSIIIEEALRQDNNNTASVYLNERLTDDIFHKIDWDQTKNAAILKKYFITSTDPQIKANYRTHVNAAINTLRKTKVGRTFKVDSYIERLLRYCNTMVRFGGYTEVIGSEEKAFPFDLATQFAHNLHASFTNTIMNPSIKKDLLKKKIIDENGRLVSEYAMIMSAKTDWFNRPYNSNTAAMLYMPSKEDFANFRNGEYKFSEAMDKAIENAHKIINAGGCIYTLGRDILSDNLSLASRKEDSNKELWNRLLKEGFFPLEPKSPTGAKVTGLTKWVKPTTDKVKELLAELQKNTKALEEFKPSAVVTELRDYNSIDVVLSNYMYERLISTDDYLTSNGNIVFPPDDPLYNNIQEVLKTVTPSNKPLKMKLMLPEEYITFDIGQYIEQNDNIVIPITSEINVMKTEGAEELTTDTTNFAKFSNPTDTIIVSQNPKLKLGVDKANTYIYSAVNNFVDKVLVPTMKREKQTIEKTIDEIQAKIISITGDSNTKKKKYNKEQREELSKLYKDLRRKRLDLKAINDKKYSRIINSIGVTKLVNELRNYYKVMATLPTSKTRSKASGEMQKAYDKLYQSISASIAVHSPIKDKLKRRDLYPKLAEDFARTILKCVDQRIESAKEIYENFDMLLPYVLKNISARYPVKMSIKGKDTTTNNYVITVKDTEQQDTSINTQEENVAENDVQLSVSDFDTKYKDDWQSRDADPVESVTQRIWALLRALPETASTPETGYYKLNELGDIQYHNEKLTYNFLRQRLSGVSTFEEMVDRINDLIKSGKWEYSILLKYLESPTSGLRQEFFSAMNIVAVERTSVKQSKATNDAKNVNKVINNTKDAKLESIEQTTMNNLAIQNRLSEKFDLLSIPADRLSVKTEEAIKAVNAVVKKFKEADYKYEDAIKKAGYSIESREANNIFLMPEHTTLCNELLNTFTEVLQGVGISMDYEHIRAAVRDYTAVYKLESLLTNNGYSDHNPGLLWKINEENKKPNLSYKKEDGGYYFIYKNLFEFLAPAFTEIAQPSTTYLDGKNMSNYEYPSFISEVFKNLNDFSKDPVTNQRKNQIYIEEHYMYSPYIYKENNVNEILENIDKYIDSFANKKRKPDFTALLNFANRLRELQSDEYIKDDVEEIYANGIYTFSDNYFLNFTSSNFPKAIIRHHRKNLLIEEVNEAKNAKILPPNCPELQTDVWYSEWLEKLYYNKVVSNPSLKKENWNKLKQRLLNDVNKKAYRYLKEGEYQQYLLDTYFTVYNQSKGSFGGFYAPIASDKENGLTEVFANVEGSITDIPRNVATRLAKIVEAETAMHNAFFKKFIHRLEAYHRFNKARINMAKAGLPPNDLTYRDFEGWSEVEQNIDVQEKPLEFKTIEVNGQQVHIIDGIEEMQFDSKGNLIENKTNDKLIQARIDKWKLDYQYVKYNPNSEESLLEQVQRTLHTEFIKYLEALPKNATIPSQQGNLDIFIKENKGNEEEEYSIEDDEFDPYEEASYVNEGYDAENYGEVEEEEEEEGISYLQLEENEEIIKKINPAVINRLRKFFYCQAYATTQLHLLTSTTPAFFNGPIDYQKRSFEYQTKAKRLDVTALPEDQRKQRAIYLADIYKNCLYEGFKTIIQNSTHLTEAEKEDAWKTYYDVEGGSMCITDGQAWRSPSAYIKIQKLIGRWNEEKQAAFDRLCNPNIPFNVADVRTLLLGPIKGFSFGMEKLNVTNDYAIPKPVQHKDSEACLLNAIIDKRLGRDSVLRGVAQFMEDYNVDIAVYTSGVKVGGAGEIDLNSAKTGTEAYNILKSRCFFTNGQENNQVIHEMEWRDYGMVSETPEHFFEQKALLGTQVRRIFYGDYEESKVYNIEDPLTGKITPMTGKEVLSKYDKIIFDILTQDFAKLRETFRNPEELENYLLEEVSGNPLYPSDLSDYCRFNRTQGADYGKFDKLVSPKNYKKTQQLLLSLVKNRITMQKIAGGSLTQVSVAYANEGLEVKTEKRLNSEGQMVDVPIEAECLLPVYMEPLFANMLDENGYINIDTLNETYKDDPITLKALTNMIGYRIPTEGLSSILKLKVKGFSAGYDGGSIILPKEIVALSGSDFDIDKMYIHRFAFKEVYDKMTGITKVKLLTPDMPNLSDAEKKDALNNELVKLMMSIMILPENNMSVIRPQGFKNLEKSSYIMNILNRSDSKEILKKIEKETGLKGIVALRSLNADKLKKLTKDENSYSYLNPTTQVFFQQQNMIGKKMLGAWAIAKAAHSLFQRSGLTLKPKYQFYFNDAHIVEPDPIYIKAKDPKNNRELLAILSAELGSYVGGAADNAKNPILAKLGITAENISTAIYLARIGLDSTSIALLLHNDLFSDISPITLFEHTVSDEDKEAFTSRELLVKAANDNYEGAISMDEVRRIVFTDDLIREIRKEDYMSTENIKVQYITDSGRPRTITLQKGQVAKAINKFYKEIVKLPAKQLDDLSQVTRMDSNNGSLQASMSHAMYLLQRIEHAYRVLNDNNGKNSVFNQRKGTKFFDISFNSYGDIEKQPDTLSGFAQYFMNYGVLSIRDLFKDKLPHFGATYQEAFRIGFQTRDGFFSTLNSSLFESAWFRYHLAQLPIFNGEVIDGKYMDFNQKMDYYRHKMVPEYYQMIAKYPKEVGKNPFILALTPSRPLTEEEIEGNKTADYRHQKARILRLPRANKLLEDTKIKLQDGFLKLFNSNNKEIVQFAWDLFKYSFYRQGISYLPDGYGHLIPNEIWDNVPKYADLCNKLLDTSNSISNGKFIEDFLLNCESFTKQLFTIPYKRFAPMYKTQQNDASKPVLNEFITKEMGFLPTYIALSRFNKEKGANEYIVMKYNNKKNTYYSLGSKNNGEDSIATTTVQFTPYRLEKSEKALEYTNSPVSTSGLNNLARALGMETTSSSVETIAENIAPIDDSSALVNAAANVSDKGTLATLEEKESDLTTNVETECEIK